MNAGDRVLHPEHPEFGYGTIRLVEESILDDRQICQVAFDWMPGLTAAAESALSNVPRLESRQIIAKTEWGAVDELQRRLGCALVMAENSQTAAFIRAFTMPLPHQAFVLEKILAHRRLGHVIADDVGMGKTIEAGLVIATLRQRDPRTRVLVLAPAGVVLQWQDDMLDHFGLTFDIAGRDFTADRGANWDSHTLVLASLDLLKQDRLREVLQGAPPFDLVVCDEAHRLTARRDFIGNDLYRTQNYRFVEWLVQQRVVSWENQSDGTPRSPRLLLMSATPHQGDDLRFAYLLQLARPDKVSAESAVAEGVMRDAAVLEECMTRTAKKRAVDWSGKPIFRGHDTRTLNVALTEAEKNVLAALALYVQRDMVIKEDKGSALVRALAMHTYQKIAASSWAALDAALTARLARAGGGQNAEGNREGAASMGAEFEYVGGDRERFALEELLTSVRSLRGDSKWETVERLLESGAGFREDGDRLLIFTQYRVTQAELSKRLEARGEVVMEIHGEIDIADRRKVRKDFEDGGTVLISTEAGSEGVNIHKKCHLMVNYDQPWNPMRLLQRIGRLDRYGQKEKVRVANLRAPEGWDAQISQKIANKLVTVQAAMGIVADEDYATMILGGVHEAINLAEVMAASDWGRDEKKVDDFVDDAVRSVLARRNALEQLFRESLGMPSDYGQGLPKLGPDEFRMAFAWAAAGYGITLREARTSENRVLKGVYHFTLPEAFRGGLRATKECHLVFDREVYAEVRNESLGRVRGQEIKPTLAGLGDEVTDWFFRGALQSFGRNPIFALKRTDVPTGSGSWWVVMAARWKGNEKWAGPDRVWILEVSENGAITRVPEPREAFQVLASADLGVGREQGVAIPELKPVMAYCRRELKELVGDAHDAKALALFPLLLMRWVD